MEMQLQGALIAINEKKKAADEQKAAHQHFVRRTVDYNYFHSQNPPIKCYNGAHTLLNVNTSCLLPVTAIKREHLLSPPCHSY